MATSRGDPARSGVAVMVLVSSDRGRAWASGRATGDARRRPGTELESFGRDPLPAPGARPERAGRKPLPGGGDVGEDLPQRVALGGDDQVAGGVGETTELVLPCSRGLHECHVERVDGM